MFVRNCGVGLALLVAGLVSSACWFSSPSAAALVDRATGKALAAETLRFELSVSVEGDIEEEDADLAEVTLHGLIDSTNEASELVIGILGAPITVRTVGDFTYVRFDDLGKWMKMPTDEFVEFGDILAPLFDPYGLLDELGVDASNVEHEGSEEIRGRKAERFSIEVPVREFDQDVEDLLQLTRDTTIWFWIGEDGLPARVVIESKGDGADFDMTANGEVTMRLTIDLFGWANRSMWRRRQKMR